MFKKKSKPQNLETELAALRQRVGALDAKRVAAEAELAVATEARQTFHVEGDIDDVGTAQKLQDAVNAAASRIVGLEDAISVIQTQITDIERRLDADRTQAERAAAADKLSHSLDAVEKVLPRCLEEGRRFVSALQELYHNFEAMQAAEFFADALSQIETAAAFVLTEQRAMVPGIADGSMPVPPAKVPAPVVTVEAPAPTMTVFMMRSARFRDHEGKRRFAGQFTDSTMPVPTAQNAMRLQLAVSTADPRRGQLLGVRGGDYNPRGIDVIDIDEAVEHSGMHFIGPDNHSDVIAQANFTPLDRGPDRTATIPVHRV